jgi:hypothetical protein
MLADWRELPGRELRPNGAITWFAKSREITENEGLRPLRAIVDH